MASSQTVPDLELGVSPDLSPMSQEKSPETCVPGAWLFSRQLREPFAVCVSEARDQGAGEWSREGLKGAWPSWRKNPHLPLRGQTLAAGPWAPDPKAFQKFQVCLQSMAPGNPGVEFQNDHLLAKLCLVRPESYLCVEGVLSPEAQSPSSHPRDSRGLLREKGRKVGAKI